MRWTLTQGATSPSARVSDPGNQFQSKKWHVYCSGTFGAGVAQVQISPDDSFVLDAASRWFSPAILNFTAAGEVFYEGRFRKCRGVVTGGTGPTSIILEVV
jgi:hypothetical protein